MDIQETWHYKGEVQKEISLLIQNLLKNTGCIYKKGVVIPLE